MDVRRIARQPIFDRDDVAVGYELLFRGSFDSDDDEMTLQTMTAALLEFGLDAIIDTRQGWLNCTAAFLTEKQYELLPADRVVLEVLEHQLPTPTLRDALTAARSLGYRVALDDFGREGIHDALVGDVDVVKVDLLLDDAMAVITELRARDVVVLAEKVETRAQREAAADAGASLFQGYYFAQPEVLEHRQLGPAAASTLRLMMLLGSPETDLDELVEALSNDAALAARVLRAANAAIHGLPRRVDSVREAVVFLGAIQVRRLVLVLLFSGLRASPPEELIRLAVARAELCHQLSGHARMGPDVAHTAGLLSVLDGLLGHPVPPEELSTLGLSDSVITGIVERQGPFGEVLDIADRALGLAEGALPPELPLDTVRAFQAADRMTAAVTS